MLILYYQTIQKPVGVRSNCTNVTSNQTASIIISAELLHNFSDTYVALNHIFIYAAGFSTTLQR